MLFTVAMLLVLLVVALPGVAAVWFGPSPASHCYFSDLTRKTQPDSRTACQAIGGRLPHLKFATGQAEHNYITSQAEALIPIDETLSYGGGGIWFDPTDVAVENTFVDQNGLPMQWVNPNILAFNNAGSAGNQDCIQAVMQFDWQWNDYQCEVPHWFVCQITPVYTCTQPAISDGVIAPLATDYPSGSVISIDCDTGFSATGGGSAMCSPSCPTAAWSPVPACVRIICPNVTITNGEMTTPTPIYAGQSGSLSCFPGYRLSHGTGDYDCDNDGNWIDLPTCIQIECPLLEIANGYKTNTTTLYAGDNTTVICDPGYQLAGAGDAVCNISGVWTSIPQCDRVECPVLNIPDADLTITTTIYAGQGTGVSCHAGYTISGGDKANCSIDTAEWMSVPVCVRNECPNITITNGALAMAGTIYSGERTAVNCDLYYARTGGSEAACGMTGEWDTIPECVQIPCPNLTISNGHVDPTTSFAGEMALVTCDDGYIASALGADCLEDGSWSTKPKCIKLCQHWVWAGGKCMDSTNVIFTIFVVVSVGTSIALAVLCANLHQ